MKIIGFIEEPAIIKQILQHLCLWDIRNNGPLQTSRLNIVRKPVYLSVRDHAPTGDEVWSQVPNYGYWAECPPELPAKRHNRTVAKIPCFSVITNIRKASYDFSAYSEMSCQISSECPFNI
jgi:hypothetical protein